MTIQHHTENDVQRLRKEQGNNIAPSYVQSKSVLNEYPMAPVAIGDFVNSEYWGEISATLYNKENADFGLDPWRDIDPDGHVDGEGFFLHWSSETTVPYDFIIYVWKSEIDRVGGFWSTKD